jgi:uncharacterized membrane protein
MRLAHEARVPASAEVLKRVALAAATIVVAINIWTGCPLAALWVGSRVAGGGGLSMFAVVVVVVVLAVLTFTMAMLLTRLNAAYDQLVDRPQTARRTSPWLRSMRGERESLAREHRGISAVERAVIVSVVACVLTFEVWLLFFAGSPLPA